MIVIKTSAPENPGSSKSACGAANPHHVPADPELEKARGGATRVKVFDGQIGPAVDKGEIFP
jgi:hypothetical protein